MGEREFKVPDENIESLLRILARDHLDDPPARLLEIRYIGDGDWR